MSDNPEDLFPPRPGGMVDTARKRAQAEAGQLEALTTALPEPDSKIAVPVTETGCELARARTFSVSTDSNPVVELLGRDDQRREAVIMTLDAPVVISFSQQAADDPRNQANAAGLSANGFVLPVNVPFTVRHKGVIYCTAIANTSGDSGADAPTRVSVAAFSYADQ